MKQIKRLKRLISLLLPLPLLICLSGCWSYRELNNFSYLIGLGIDKGEAPGTFRLIEQLALPSNMKAGAGKSGGGSEAAFWNVENEGETFFATIRDMTRKVQRRPFFGHNKVIVFGREVAQEGIFKYLDLFVRNTETRISTFMVVAKGEAKEILSQKPHLEKITADKIEKVMEGHIFNSYYNPIQIKDFIEYMLGEKQAAVVPIIELIELKVSEEKEGGGGGKESGGGGAGEGEQSGMSNNPESSQKSNLSKNRVLVINGSAVFKEYKMIGELDNIQSRGHSFATNKAVGGIIVVESPESEEKLDIEFSEVHCKMTPVVKEGKAKILIEVNMKGSLSAQQSPKNLATPEKLIKVKENLNDAVKNEILSSIDKAKELDADIFGFGNAIYRKSPKLWKKLKDNWDEEFKKLEVEVKVDAKLSGTNSISSIAKPGEGK